VNPYTRVVLFVIRLAAFGLVFTSLLYLASSAYFTVGRQSSGESVFQMILKGIPLLLGIVLWIKSYAIARKLTEDFDD
jgi:hypothetical protein